MTTRPVQNRVEGLAVQRSNAQIPVARPVTATTRCQVSATARGLPQACVVCRLAAASGSIRRLGSKELKRNRRDWPPRSGEANVSCLRRMNMQTNDSDGTVAAMAKAGASLAQSTELVVGLPLSEGVMAGFTLHEPGWCSWIITWHRKTSPAAAFGPSTYTCEPDRSSSSPERRANGHRWPMTALCGRGITQCLRSKSFLDAGAPVCETSAYNADTMLHPPRTERSVVCWEHCDRMRFCLAGQASQGESRQNNRAL